MFLHMSKRSTNSGRDIDVGIAENYITTRFPKEPCRSGNNKGSIIRVTAISEPKTRNETGGKMDIGIDSQTEMGRNLLSNKTFTKKMANSFTRGTTHNARVIRTHIDLKKKVGCGNAAMKQCPEKMLRARAM